MTRPDIFVSTIFDFADSCIEEGAFPGFEDKRYVLLLGQVVGESCEIRRAGLDFPLPRPCRVWLAKGKKTYLLGDSHSLPKDLGDGVRPPYIG